MVKCDPMAYAKCPHRRYCSPLEDAVFMQGSLCDQFNQRVKSHAVALNAATNTKTILCPICNGHGFINGGDEHSSWSRTCDRCHGTGYTQVPMTIGDRIRAMSDEDLTDIIYELNMEGTFCQNRKECLELLDNDKLTDDMCKKCLLEWLRKPADDAAVPHGIFLDKQESGLTEED